MFYFVRGLSLERNKCDYNLTSRTFVADIAIMETDFPF